MKRFPALAALLLLSACAGTQERGARASDAFFANLTALCGKAYQGRLVSKDAEDAGLAAERLVMHVRDCSAGEIRIPFRMGKVQSGTWIVSRTAKGLRLTHREDQLSGYGGESKGRGSAERQLFPSDDFSKQLFRHQGVKDSVSNQWALEVRPGRVFAYELKRPGRFFRAEYDLTRSVRAPD